MAKARRKTPARKAASKKRTETEQAKRKRLAAKRQSEAEADPFKGLSTAQRKFLKAYELTLTLSKASDIAGICRANHSKWMSRSQHYPRAFEIARASGIDGFVEEARRRAIDGIPRKLFNNGAAVIDPDTGKQAVEYHYSDRLLLRLLERFDPEQWAGRQQVTGELAVNHTGASLQDAVRALHENPDFINYLRDRAGDETCNSGTDGKPSQ